MSDRKPGWYVWTHTDRPDSKLYYVGIGIDGEPIWGETEGSYSPEYNWFGTKTDIPYVEPDPEPDTSFPFIKVRKKPVQVEAMRITEDVFDAVYLSDLYIKGVRYNLRERTVAIETSEGVMKGKAGDWIIKGVNGELHPCKHEIFEKTYDVITEPEPEPDTSLAEVIDRYEAYVTGKPMAAHDMGNMDVMEDVARIIDAARKSDEQSSEINRLQEEVDKARGSTESVIRQRDSYAKAEQTALADRDEARKDQSDWERECKSLRDALNHWRGKASINADEIKKWIASYEKQVLDTKQERDNVDKLQSAIGVVLRTTHLGDRRFVKLPSPIRDAILQLEQASRLVDGEEIDPMEPSEPVPDEPVTTDPGEVLEPLKPGDITEPGDVYRNAIGVLCKFGPTGWAVGDQQIYRRKIEKPEPPKQERREWTVFEDEAGGITSCIGGLFKVRKVLPGDLTPEEVERLKSINTELLADRTMMQAELMTERENLQVASRQRQSYKESEAVALSERDELQRRCNEVADELDLWEGSEFSTIEIHSERFEFEANKLRGNQ